MSTTLEIAPSPAGLLTLTPAAIQKAKEFLSRMDESEGLYLRLGVRGGGCSGFSYVIEFDRDVDPKFDRLFEFEGLKVVVDRKSLVLLAGTTVDYTGDLHMVGEGGFAFENPNASKSCGCGVSFQA